MWGCILSEPVVRDASVHGQTLITDFGAIGALFDIHVVDTDARSYQCHSSSAVLVLAEAEQNRKYYDACM